MRITKAEARRFLVGRHGLDRFRERTSLDEVARSDGALQYDPIDVVGPNLDLLLHARVAEYAVGAFQERVNEGSGYFEAYHNKKTTFRPGEQYGELTRIRGLVYQQEAEALQQKYRHYWNDIVQRATVEELCSSDIDRGERIDGHWGKPASLSRTVLDAMVQSGVLVVARRTGGKKYCTVPGRVYPKEWLSDPFKSDDECFRRCIERWVHHAGLATRRQAEAALKPTVKGSKRYLVDELVDTGRLVVVEVKETDVALLVHKNHVWMFDADFCPDGNYRLLPPLDSLLVDRDLIQMIFDFSYVWEVYKRRTDRQYGYYVLPVLYRDRLVGRVELARTEGTVTVVAQWAEQEQSMSDRKLQLALRRLAAFLGRGGGAGDAGRVR